MQSCWEHSPPLYLQFCFNCMTNGSTEQTQEPNSVSCSSSSAMINQNVEWIWNMHSGKIHFKNESSLMSAVWSSSSFGSEWANKGLSYTALNCENNLSFGSEQAGKKRPLLYSSALCDWYNTVLNCKKSLEWFCEPDSRKSLCSPGGGESQQTEVAAAVCFMVCFANIM